MGLFGLFSKKELEEKEKQARIEGRNETLQGQQTSLSNLAKGSQVKFSVPYFDVFDPRFENYAVPVAVHGVLIYAVDDIQKFNTINKSVKVNDGVFEQKVRSQLAKYIKGVVTNAPYDNNVQVLQLERKILEISELIQRLVSPQIEQLFAINVRSIDITQIIVDKDSRGYRELKAVTTELEAESLKARHNANLSNFNLQNSLNQDLLKTQSSLNLDAMRRQQELSLGGQEELQRMQLENQRETMRIQREEMQRAARLQTETNFLGAHQANLNASQSMSGMPPALGAVPQVQYMIGVNGQQTGPFDWNHLQQFVHQGQLTHQTYVWKQGMANWEFAGNVAELQPLFMGAAPQMPDLPSL